MANYKLTDHFWETSGIYDIGQGKTQREINNALVDAVQTESVFDKVPYAFRKTGGDNTVGKRENDKLVGGTVVWNQRCVTNNNTFTNWNLSPSTKLSKSVDSDALTVTVSEDLGTSGSFLCGWYVTVNSGVFLNGHKYYISADLKVNSANGQAFFTIQRSNGVSIFGSYPSDWYASENSWVNHATIGACGEPDDISVGLRFRATATSIWLSGDTASAKNFIIIDLTQMFGSTIADYLYNLETATAGAGVAFFKSLFPKSYYAYNAGTLMSVNAARHETVGKNLCYQVLNGYVSAGTNYGTYANDPTCRSLVFDCIAGTEYVFSGITHNRFVWGIFDSVPSAGTITYNYGNLTSSSTTSFTAPKSGVCVIYVSNSAIDTSKAQVEIGTVATAYEPYTKHTYPLDSTLTLRGIPKLDSNNKLYYDGDTYASDGTVTRRYGIVDLGTLTYVRSSLVNNAFVAVAGLPNDFPVAPSSRAVPNWVCRYQIYSNNEIEGENVDKAIAWRVSGSNKGVIIRDSSYSTEYNNEDCASFKAAMSGVYLVYELTTPTTESASPYTNPQICDGSGTEEYVDAGVLAEERDVSVPVGHDTEYMTETASNAAGWDTDYSTMIAPTEKDFTATRAYSTNNLFIVSGQLYKATSSIANGAAITVGTNCAKTTIGEILTTLLNA